jgi:hypothetical protein
MRSSWRGCADSALPYASRLEIRTKGNRDGCTCQQIRFPWLSSHGVSSSNQTQHPEVEALIDEDNSRPICELIQVFPHLLVFSGWEDTFEDAISSNPDLFCNLTHLKLGHLWTYRYDRDDSSNITLPQLHTLTIDCSTRWTPNEYGALVEDMDPPKDPHLLYRFWSMPKLTNLSIMGQIKQPAPDPEFLEEEFNVLLEKVGPTLQGLSYTPVYIRGSHMFIHSALDFPSSVWKYCPNLKTIRGYLLARIQDIRPPFSWPSIELILCDFDDLDDYWWLEDPEYTKKDFLSVLQSFDWAITSFGMGVSWCTLYNRLQVIEYPECLPHLVRIYDFFYGMPWGSRDFKDRHGQGMDSAGAKQVMSWLQIVPEKFE